MTEAGRSNFMFAGKSVKCQPAEITLAWMNYALDRVREAVFLINEDGNFQYVNEEACRALDYSQEELLNLGVACLDPDCGAECWTKRWHDLREHGSLVFEGRYKTKGGRIFPVEINASYIEFGGQAHCLCLANDISKHKRMVMELRASERKFRSLVENSPDNIVRYDQHCRRTYANPTIIQEFGVPPEQLLGTTPPELFPEGWTAIRDYELKIRQVLASGDPDEIEIAIPHSSGRIHIHHIRLAAERDDDGNIVGVLALGRNITDRKRRELLEESRRCLFERLAGGGGLPELLDNIIFFLETLNPYFVAGIMLVTMDGKHLSAVSAPHLPAEYLRTIHVTEIGEGMASCGTAAWRGQPVIAEDISNHPCWVLHKEPALRAGLQSCWSEPIFESSGKIVGTIDIYQRKPGRPTEEDQQLIRQAVNLAAIIIEYKKMEEELRYSERKFRTLAENLPDMVVRYDRNCRRVYVNPIYEKETGISSEEAINAPLEDNWYLTIPVEEYKNELHMVMITGIPAKMLLDWVQSDGQHAIHDVHVLAERNLDGQIIGCLAIFHNVTRLKEAECRLTKLAETSPGVIYTFLQRADGTSCMPYVSPRIRELNGLCPADAAKDMSETFARIHHDDLPRFLESIKVSAKSLSPWHAEFRTRHPEKGDVWVEGHSMPERQPDGAILWYGFLHDITERKRIEESLCIKREQLAAMTIELSFAEERERLRIASVLHDHIGQTLLLCRIKLGAAAGVRIPKTVRTSIAETMELLDQTIHDAHSLTVQLNPPILAAAGLEAALEWLGQRMESDYGLQVTFENDMKTKPLGDELRSIVYQCGRELLINVAKHAKTDHARLVISRNGGMFQLAVEDKGSGFEPAALVPDISKDCRYGLLSIQIMIERLGGRVVFDSMPGCGSSVTIMVPISRNGSGESHEH